MCVLNNFSPPLWEFNEHRSLIKQLQHEHNFKCGCMMCRENICLPVADEVNFTKNPLYTNGIALIDMTVAEFRKLPLSTIEKHEKAAIKFVEKYGRFHPTKETIDMENALLIMWYILAKEFSR